MSTTTTALLRVPLIRRRAGFDEATLTRTALPPLGPRLQVIRTAMVVIAVLSLSVLVHLYLLSGWQHGADQRRAFDEFRHDLANGTPALGPMTTEGTALDPKTPVARLEIPTIELDEIVGEGTSAGVLSAGPGHRLDTVLPGQVGESVVFGKSTTYGAPFKAIADLAVGDEIIVTTGQGNFEYAVTGVRYDRDALPPPLEPGASRLTLATAGGSAFVPKGVVYVDAMLADGAVAGSPRQITHDALVASDRAMGTDATSLWVLALWLQLLVVLSAIVAWAWHRWGRAQTWITAAPPLALVGLSTSAELARLLPNLF